MAEEFIRPAGTGGALEVFHTNDEASYIVHVFGKEAGVAGSYFLPTSSANTGIKITAAGDHLALAVTPTGALAVYKNKQLLFTREEALSDIRSLTFVDLPEAAVFADDALSSSSFFIRHLAQLKVRLSFLPDVSLTVLTTQRLLSAHARLPSPLRRPVLLLDLGCHRAARDAQRGPPPRRLWPAQGDCRCHRGWRNLWPRLA